MVIDLTGPPLRAADQITVVLGDTSGGGEGSTPQTFAQRDKRFDVYVADPPVEGRPPEFARVPDALSLDIVGGMMDRLRVLVPATVPAGKQFAITIKAGCARERRPRYQGELGLRVWRDLHRPPA